MIFQPAMFEYQRVWIIWHSFVYLVDNLIRRDLARCERSGFAAETTAAHSTSGPFVEGFLLVGFSGISRDWMVVSYGVSIGNTGRTIRNGYVNRDIYVFRGFNDQTWWFSGCIGIFMGCSSNIARTIVCWRWFGMVETTSQDAARYYIGHH